MRPASMTAVLLIVLLHCCTALLVSAAASKCPFDTMVKSLGQLPVAVVREVPTKERGLQQAYTLATETRWEPLRILVSVNESENVTEMCTSQCSYLSDKTTMSKQSCFSICVSNNQISEEFKQRVVEILAQAAKLHTDRLFVHRANGSFKVPAFTNDICNKFTVPSEHRTTGVSNADMVLYVSLNNLRVSDSDSIWALPCAVNSEGRTVAAVMSFKLKTIAVPQVVMRVTAHHIAHALGFGFSEMKAKGMISVQTVRSKVNISVVTSEKVTEATRWHYKCRTVNGMELEDQERDANPMKSHAGDSIYPDSHWEARNALDELMGPLNSGPVMHFPGFYTVLTLAAFADLGYYAANFSMAEPMTWGRNAGCSLFSEKCVEHGVSKYPQMFCDDVTETQVSCRANRDGFGTCGLNKMVKKPLPDYFKYFDSPNISGVPYTFADYCPIVRPSVLCEDPRGEQLPWSSLGSSLWCLDGKTIKMKKTTTDRKTELWHSEINATCTAVSCDGGVVRVKYLGNDDWQACPEGQSITLPISHYESGSITCPKYQEVCTVDANGSSLVATKPKKGTPLTDPFRGGPPKLTKAPIIEKGSETPEGTQQDGGGTDGTGTSKAPAANEERPGTSVGSTDGTGTSKAPVTNAGQPDTPEINWTKVQLANSSAIRSVSFVCVVILLMVVVGEWLA